MVLRAIASIRTCYEIFWFYGDSFPWPSELLILRAKQMVLEQGWATSAQQEDTKEEEVTTAPLDISHEMGNDFVLLPVAEVRYTYQDSAMSTEQLHQWCETDEYANTADTRVVTECAKGRKRRKPETADEAPTLLSPTDARAWASRMTFRQRRPLSGPWMRIPTESQRAWPVAFATDEAALEANIGVVVTRSVSRFEVICDWEGTSTQDTAPPTGYDPERVYDAQTGTTFRLDGLSYGPWVDDPLQLDSYNSVHVYIPERLRYVTVMLCDLPAGMAVSAPKGYLHWQNHPELARLAKTLFRPLELDFRTINEALSTTKILQRLSHTHCLIDDLGMNVLAWTLSQFQGERIQAYSTEALLGAYDWERLLRWRSRGPESLGVMVSSPRIISLTDAWVWFLWYPPCSNDPYRYKNGILELPWINGRTPLGIGLDETNELCACFSTEVPRGTIIEHLDVDCLPSHPTDLDI